MKYTDEQIKKAVECCNNSSCEGCPYHDLNGGLFDMTCVVEMSKNALDIINRQEAEIERLREYEEIRPVGCPNCSRGNFSNSKFCSHCGTQLQGKKKDVRAEAIKEFAERLKELNRTKLILWHEDIDNLVKEMVGESVV